MSTKTQRQTASKPLPFDPKSMQEQQRAWATGPLVHGNAVFDFRDGLRISMHVDDGTLQVSACCERDRTVGLLMIRRARTVGYADALQWFRGVATSTFFTLTGIDADELTYVGTDADGSPNWTVTWGEQG